MLTEEQKKTIADFKDKSALLKQIEKLEKSKFVLLSKIDKIDERLAVLADKLKNPSQKADD